MFSSNTETGIAATYEDGDGTIDLVIGSGVITNAMLAGSIANSKLANSSITVSDGSNSTATALGGTITFAGTSNEVEVAESSGTVTVGLPSNVTIGNNLTVTGNLTVSGTTTQTGPIVSDDNFTGLLNSNTGNSSDFGFFGKYVESSTTKYAGLYFDASTDNTFRLFADTQTEPAATVDTSATGYAAANLITAGITATTGTFSGAVSGTTGTFSGDLAVDTNVLKVDTSNNRIGINQASPTVSIDAGSNTDAILVPVGTTAQRPSGAAGQFRYNSTTSQFEGYTDSWGAIAGGGGGSSSAFAKNTFTGDGSTTAFTLSTSMTSEDGLIVFIDGVYQADNVYSVSGTTLTFATAPVNSRVIEVFQLEGGIVGTAPSIDTMTGDGSDTTLSLSVTPTSENQTFVTIDGVVQHKDTYAVSGSTLTFSAAPPTGTKVECITFSNVSIATFQDADSDTKIQVEETTDEDKIRFDIAGTEEMVMDASGIVINDGSNDRDFRIESNGDANMFFVDGTNDKIGIGTASPAAQVEINGDGELLRLDGTGGSARSIRFRGLSTSTPAFITIDGSFKLHCEDSGTHMEFHTADTERMRIDSNGSLLIGSSTSIASNIGLQVTGTNAAGFISLFRDDSSIVADDDLGGILFYGDDNSATTQFAYMRATAEGTHSDGDNPTALRFGITLDGSETPVERFRINSSGNAVFSGDTITVGDSHTFGNGGGDNLHIESSSGENIVINSAGGIHVFQDNGTERMRISAGDVLVGKTATTFSTAGIHMQGSTGRTLCTVSGDNVMDLNRTTSNGVILGFYLNGSSVGTISTNTHSLPSDRNFKTDISDLNLGLNLVTKLKPSQYNYKIDSEDCPKMYGLIAQDLEESLTEVGIEKNSTWLLQHEPKDDEKQSDYSLDYTKLIPILINSIQEQQEQIEALQSEINTLKGGE